MSQAGNRHPGVQRCAHVVARRLQDAGVLVNVRTNEIFELNDTAMRVWESLDGSAGVSELAAQLVAEFEIDRDRAEREVHLLLERFRTQGLTDV